MRELIDRAFLRVTLRPQSGQGMLEYALVIAFVAIVVIGALTIFGVNIINIFNYSSNSLNV